MILDSQLENSTCNNTRLHDLPRLTFPSMNLLVPGGQIPCPEVKVQSPLMD